MIHIAPSLLSANFGAFSEASKVCAEGGADFLHFDVMDGRFVPNITFGAGVVRDLRPISAATFDVHLMIVEPERYVEEFVRAGAEIITVHAEATTHLNRTLSLIKSLGCKAGVALNPATPLHAVDWVLDEIDLLLIMTVNPGFGGQKFIRSSYDKVAAAKELISRAGHDILLEVDGGVDADSCARLALCGANVFVAGSSIFGHSGGVAAGIRALQNAAVQSVGN